MKKITTKVRLKSPTRGTLITAEGILVRFSPFQCFPMTGEADELLLIDRLADHLMGLEGDIALYRWGPFLDFMLDHAPRLLEKTVAIIDHRTTETTYRGRPIVAPTAIPNSVRTVFLCDTRADHRTRMRAHLPKGLTVLCPDIIPQIAIDDIPVRSWLTLVKTVYPNNLPDLVFEKGKDVLLMDLPARMLSMFPTGFGYVHNAIKASNVTLQTIDADVIFAHLYHIHRLYDLGEPPVMSNGKPMPDDPWYVHHIPFWENRDNWPLVVELFSEFLDDVVNGILAAAPKILGLSVHNANRWCAQEVARRVKLAAPEIVILVGGFTCYSPSIAPYSINDWDYLVIGEADHIVGPLVERLARGERPGNVKGVMSRFDDPNIAFQWAPRPADLNLIEMPKYEWVDDINIYRTYNGHSSVPVIASRGCRWSQCTFCAERYLWRIRAPEKFVNELEWFVDHGFNGFVFNESDLNGDPETLLEICREVMRRGLKISLTGQLRIHAKSDQAFFDTLRAAGFHSLRFGVDAWSRNTLKLQRKGYTVARIKENLEACHNAGIKVDVNMVVGVPHETEDDITESIANLLDNAPYIATLANINCLILANGGMYWEEPEKHGIKFRGDKEQIFKDNPLMIPENLWYSEDPYIDGDIRRARFERIIAGIMNSGMNLSEWAANVNVKSTLHIKDEALPPRDLYAEHKFVHLGNLQMALDRYEVDDTLLRDIRETVARQYLAPSS